MKTQLESKIAVSIRLKNTKYEYKIYTNLYKFDREKKTETRETDDQLS